MKNRYELPPARVLHAKLEYRDGRLYWKEDAKYGRVKAGDMAGCLNKVDGYRRIGIGGVYYMEHRVIWRMFNPYGKMPFLLDHIDGDTTNNRIENLRSVSGTENQHNRHKRTKNKVATALDKYLKESENEC